MLKEIIRCKGEYRCEWDKGKCKSLILKEEQVMTPKSKWRTD